MRLPSGFRDISSNMAILYETVLDKIKKVFRLYGFEPLYTPHLELWETLRGKYGDEAEKLLIWRFEDVWSKEWYALRYDHTVPLARHFSSASYALPFKRYTIGSVFRHERPQRGRFREFMQADADIVGSPYPEADAELINLVYDTMCVLGFSEFKILLSDRRILTGILRSKFGIKDELAVFRAIDKLDKIGRDGVRKELERYLPSSYVEEILEIISISGSLDECLKKLESEFSNSLSSLGIEHLREMSRYILERAKRNVEFSLELVRGLDYYTGPVWEVIVEGIAIGSVGGGGRYDELLRIYTKMDVPATGTSFGIDRLIESGIQAGIFNIASPPKVFIISMLPDAYSYAWSIAYELRASGIPTELDLMRRKHSKQREYAKKKGGAVFVFVGKKEIENKTLAIFYEGERHEMPKNDAVKFICRLLKDYLTTHQS